MQTGTFQSRRGFFRLRQIALLVRQLLGLEHHMRVKAWHIMLATLARRKLRFENLQRLELIEHRPLILKVPCGFSGRSE